MATGVGLAHFISTDKFAYPDNPLLGPEMGVVSPHTSQVIANFLSKFSNFRCHGNRGWSGTNFTSIVKFADPDNPRLGPEIEVISPMQAELLPIFCQNFQIFVAMATGVGLAQISLAQLNSPTPITPY